jgi:hypothetical protein
MVTNITVYLDNTPSEFMDTLRCGFIVAEDEAGEETFHNNLLDSSDYYSVKELIDDIVGIFKIHRDAVLIAS